MNRYSRISTTAVALGVIATGCSSDPTPMDDAPAPGATIAPASGAPSREAWRRQMSKTPTPRDGCFRAAHPNTEWVEVPCATPPAVPYSPAPGGAGRAGGAMTVGNGADDSSAVSGTISWAEGSFPRVSGVTSIVDGTANNFSLQLNS